MFKPILFKFDKMSPLVRKTNKFCYTREFKSNWALLEGPAHIHYNIPPSRKGGPGNLKTKLGRLLGTSFEPIH